MKNTILIGGIMLILCLSFNALAGKVEKKKTILNTNCKPLGSKCIAANASSTKIMYVYDEPKPQSFSMQFSEQEVLLNEELKKILIGKTQLILEEEMPIPDDVILELRMPERYTVAKGNYAIRYSNKTYTIIFKE